MSHGHPASQGSAVVERIGGYTGPTEPTPDELRELCDHARTILRESSVQLASYIKANGDDAHAYDLADKILVTDQLERRMRARLIAEGGC